MSAVTASRVSDTQPHNAIVQVRETFALAVAVMVMVLPAFGMIAQYGAGSDIFSGRQILLNLSTFLAGVGTLVLARRKKIAAAGMVASIVMTITAIFVSQNDVRTLMSLLAIVVASTLMGRWYYRFIVTVLLALPLLRIVQIVGETGLAPNPLGVEAVVSAGIIASIAVIFRYFYGVTQRTSSNAELALQRLSTIATVGRQTSRLMKFDDLINESVTLIKEQFGYYHVQIFLVDERREYAVLVASTGEAGRRLLARNHKLGIGSQSVIGRATLANEPVLINDTDNEPGHAFNPLLPETRAELALPMQLQTETETRVMGALDVQSEELNAFSPSDVQALQALANQLAVAIRNAQLFETQEASLQENETLIKQAQASLEEIQRLNSQLTRKAWDGFVEAHTDITGVKVEGETVTFNAGWTPLMIEACKARDTISQKDDGIRITATPMMIRNEIIGAVEVVGGNEEELNLIDAIVAFTERFAVAMENVRLVDEAQAASAQEQRISAVVSRFQEAETVDELLQITLTELAETLEADGGSIRVGLSATGQAAR